MRPRQVAPLMDEILASWCGKDGRTWEDQGGGSGRVRRAMWAEAVGDREEWRHCGI